MSYNRVLEEGLEKGVTLLISMEDAGNDDVKVSILPNTKDENLIFTVLSLAMARIAGVDVLTFMEIIALAQEFSKEGSPGKREDVSKEKTLVTDDVTDEILELTLERLRK